MHTSYGKLYVQFDGTVTSLICGGELDEGSVIWPRSRLANAACVDILNNLLVNALISFLHAVCATTCQQVFDACEDLGGSIVFLDEIDAIAASRDTGTMHEATRRILSVILRKVSATTY